MDNNLHDSILGDMWNYDLVLVGIIVSIFVLHYSFISNKRDFLKEISEQIKMEGLNNNPLLKQKYDNAIRYVKYMHNVNKHCVCLLLVFLVHLFITWLFFRVISNIQYKMNATFVLGIIEGLASLYFIYMLIKIYRYYKFQTKL